MCYDKLTQQKFQKIEDLVNTAIQAPNKACAKGYVNQLKFISRSLPPPACNIASELVSATEAASGKVDNKDFYVKFAKSKLYSLESCIVKSN